MKSKYKERAEELFIQYSLKPSTNPKHNKPKHTIIDLMCQLAEEISQQSFTSGYNCMKLQVEELLLKQRKLCANKAKGIKITVLTAVGDRYIKGNVDKQSILNAKLEL